MARFAVDVIAHDPAQRIADDAGKEHTSGEECRLFQVKIVAVKKEQRYPREVEPKRPAITKINQGDGSFFLSFRKAYRGSTSNSAGVIPGCSPGSSRKYQTHAAAQARLMIPRIMNDPRHVTSAISQATKGGVSALPNRALECVIP